MPHWLSQRRREPELMDEDNVNPAELRRALGFIRQVNRSLLYTRSVVHHLQRFARRWTPGERIDILDLATGSADIPRAMLRWADRVGFELRIVAVDRHALTAQVAAEQSPDPRLRIVRSDVFHLPFDPASFDYVTCAMFLHHLDDDQVVQVMRTMDRLSRRGVIIADLLRHRRAWLWIKLATALSSPMVRHDAAVSVAQAFTAGEIQSLRDRAGLAYAAYHRHFAHRFVLAGEKH